MINPRWERLTVLLKIVSIIIVMMAILFLIAHFAIQYGVQAGEIKQFMQESWLFWLIARWCLYTFVGFMLYRLWTSLQKKVNDQPYLTAYKRLTRTAIIVMGTIEVACWVQLIRG